MSAATDLEMQLSVDYPGKRGGGGVSRRHWRRRWEKEEEGSVGRLGGGVGGVCVRLRLAIRQVAHRQLGTTNLLKPTYLDSVIASLLGECGEGGTVDMTHV